MGSRLVCGLDWTVDRLTILHTSHFGLSQPFHIRISRLGISRLVSGSAFVLEERTNNKQTRKSERTVNTHADTSQVLNGPEK